MGIYEPSVTKFHGAEWKQEELVESSEHDEYYSNRGVLGLENRDVMIIIGWYYV